MRALCRISLHSAVQDDLLSYASHLTRCWRGNVRASYEGRMTGIDVQGVPQLNGEGMHNCLLLPSKNCRRPPKVDRQNHRSSSNAARSASFCIVSPRRASCAVCAETGHLKARKAKVRNRSSVGLDQRCDGDDERRVTQCISGAGCSSPRSSNASPAPGHARDKPR